MDKKYVYFIAGGVVAVVLIFLGLFVRGQNMVNNIVPLPTSMPTASPTTGLETDTGTISGKWQWSKTQMSDGKLTEPNKSEAFVATFNDNGEVFSTTDCNSLRGSFELLPDNGIRFSQFASTMMYCEGSQEAEFARDFQNANSYKISGNELWLMLPFDSGTMVFTQL